ncbi:hypothetical protein BT67DRAFT_46371 [Trichocladium antarcticum]|uniref:Uncharacterized protein n=1 Tax=Trichocladium antarcticum TaxID=1450529 RepID=A0AAN6UHX0_9PEZI|nr:hypothetical protein BT67DRAFT_46371 [Trichocladium antarcticum]
MWSESVTVYLVQAGKPASLDDMGATITCTDAVGYFCGFPGGFWTTSINRPVPYIMRLAQLDERRKAWELAWALGPEGGGMAIHLKCWLGLREVVLRRVKLGGHSTATGSSKGVPESIGEGPVLCPIKQRHGEPVVTFASGLDWLWQVIVASLVTAPH